MSWSSQRRGLLLGAAAALAGCTLRPLYGPTGAEGGSALGALALGPLSGRNGYLFREAMARRFDLDSAAPLLLTVDLSLRQTGLIISREGDINRVNVQGTARFILRDRSVDEQPVEGTVRSVSSFSTLASPYATRVAREAAEARVVADLAERVFAQIALRRGSVT